MITLCENDLNFWKSADFFGLLLQNQTHYAKQVTEPNYVTSALPFVQN